MDNYRLRSDIPGHSPHHENAPSQNDTSADAGRMAIGRDVVFSGEISNCADLLVEGTVKAELKDGRHIKITETGRFNGTLEVMDADISGYFEGNLTVNNRLVVRPSAEIKGEIVYGMIEVHPGARIEGNMTSQGIPVPEEMMAEEEIQVEQQHAPVVTHMPVQQQPAVPNDGGMDLDIINRINGEDGEEEKTLPFRNVANG